MNIDFHYYGTYVAARIAGYDSKSAQTIAYAAQYVDNSDQAKLRDKMDNYYIKDFTPVPTFQSSKEMIKKNFMWSEATMKAITDVWVPFHFLPGNYGDNQNIKTYSGPKSDRTLLYSWTFDEQSEKQFKLLCQPNNLIVRNMINDIISNHGDKDYTLHMAGLRMHTMADTWAHMFYIGIPQWFVNNAGEEVYNIEGQTKKPVKWQRIWPWSETTDIMNGEEATPNILAYNSIVFLGHGRMGHLPDYPWMKYQYHAQWSKDDIIKDNQAYFLQAFKQMVKALQCIRTKAVFDINSYADLPPDTETIIKQILATKINDQCATWRNNIPKIQVDGVALEIPVKYDENKWIKEIDPKGDIKTTNYYFFNKSARMQVDFVVDILKANNIYPAGSSRGNIVTTKFKNKKGDYIGALYKQYQYFPKMSGNGITLQIIKPTFEPLTSGDIIEIKTTEKEAKEYNFLGAWSTKALYYYTRAYSESKQKWMIEKVDVSVSKQIKDGDAVRFKNMYYNKQPYMVTYKYWSGGTYLTTQAKGSVDEAVWIMEGLKEFDMLTITPDYFVSEIIDDNTSSAIHDDMKVYGLIEADDKANVKVLKTTLDNIGLGFLRVQLDEKQKEQVWIQLEKVANSQDN